MQVGRAIRAVGKPVLVTTKLWLKDMGEKTEAAFERSMDLLGLDRIDLYRIHWPVPARGKFVDTWERLVRLREADDRLISIGVSNFRVEDLHAIISATGVVPVVTQIELHPRFQQQTMRTFHEAHGIVTTSWSPLGRGGSLEEPVLKAIATKHGKTPAQIAIGWHLDMGLSVIPKSAHSGRLAENLAVFDFALDRDDIGRIAALDSVNARTGPDPATFDAGHF